MFTNLITAALLFPFLFNGKTICKCIRINFYFKRIQAATGIKSSCTYKACYAYGFKKIHQ